jgi:hypothetical protein
MKLHYWIYIKLQSVAVVALFLCIRDRNLDAYCCENCRPYRHAIVMPYHILFILLYLTYESPVVAVCTVCCNVSTLCILPTQCVCVWYGSPFSINQLGFVAETPMCFL